MRTTTAITTSALTAVLLLTACGSSNDDSTGAKPTPEPTITATPDTADEALDAADEEPPADNEALGLTDIAEYESEVEVSLEGFARKTSSAYAAPENTPYIKFTLKVVNGSEKTMDLNELVIMCQSGDDGIEAEQVFDEGLDGTPMTHLRPGRSITAPIGCELPKDETYMQIEVTPDYESEVAIFAGDIK